MQDIDVEIDYHAVEQTVKSNSPQKRGKSLVLLGVISYFIFIYVVFIDLNAVLPKLARRISEKQPQTPPNPSSSSAASSPVKQFTSVDDPRNTTTSDSHNNSNPPNPRERRVSVTRSGSILFKTSQALPPEAEELRNRDIEPDLNSAADRALAAASAAAQHQGNPPPTTPGGRRGSLLDANEKVIVEGREIQQVRYMYSISSFSFSIRFSSTLGSCSVCFNVWNDVRNTSHGLSLLFLFLLIMLCFPFLLVYRLEEEILI
jgi:hypothetical protein